MLFKVQRIRQTIEKNVHDRVRRNNFEITKKYSIFSILLNMLICKKTPAPIEAA